MPIPLNGCWTRISNRNKPLKKMKKLFFILLIAYAFHPSFAQDDIYTGNQKVKTVEGYSIYVKDGVSFPIPSSLSPTISFTPENTSVTISPLSNDPRTRTGNPVIIDECLCDPDENGQLNACFDFNFRSLRDLGEWRIRFCNNLHAKPSNCSGDNCFFSCSGISPSANCVEYRITVWNDPPSANISPSTTPRWNRTVTMRANSNDPDGGGVVHRWSVIDRPNGSTAALSSTTVENPTMTFASENDIGNWRLQLQVDDNEGERKTFTYSFTVPNEAPNLNIEGNTEIDALEEFSISAVNVGAADPGDDIDGGTLDFAWELLEAPPSTTFVLDDEMRTSRTISFTTTENDITTVAETDNELWRFRCTATDNEGDSDVEEITVRVNNLPPTINLSGETEIDTYEEVRVETDVLEDEDGGYLSFSWDLIQVPNSAPFPPQLNFDSDNSLVIQTNDQHAGTWIVELFVTDNEGETVSEQFTILVDGWPRVEINGPEVIGLAAFPLELDGSNSVDPDSPCPEDPNNCHQTLDPPVKDISPGISRFTWYLIDFPSEYFGEYSAGRVDEALGNNIKADQAFLSIGSGILKRGDWAFQLDIEDGEGNTDSELFQVRVFEEEGPPTANISAPATYFVNSDGILTSDVIVSGANSFDYDNLAAGGVIIPGIGITRYKWRYTNFPPTCPSLPPLPSTNVIFPYVAGQPIPDECFGTYQIMLTVIDDDSTPDSARIQTLITLNDCISDVCINNPTNQFPEIVEFTENTDVLVSYRLNPAIYQNPLFLGGVVVRLEIFHESDPFSPVYTSFESNVLVINQNGFSTFHWNGYHENGLRPKGGNYDVRISLLSNQYGETGIFVTEQWAIQIKTAEPEINDSSEQLASIQTLEDGSDPLRIDYTIKGSQFSDLLVYRIIDASNLTIFEASVFPEPFGQILWDGRNNAGWVVSEGTYQIELELFFDDSSVGKSDRLEFYVINVDLDVDTNRNGVVDVNADEDGEDDWNSTTGAIFNVNYDQDGTRTYDGFPIPDAIYFDDSGIPRLEDFVIDNAADELDITPLVIRKIHHDFPLSFRVFLKVESLEDIQSIHLYKRIAAGETAVWGSLGDRTGGAPEPLFLDISEYVNPSSPGYQGDGSGTTTFGIEGLFFRKTSGAFTFDGEIEFVLEVREAGLAGSVLYTDKVHLKVAPWIMISHNESSLEVWANDLGGENDELRLTTANDPGYFGLDNSSQLRTASGPTAGSRWFQDHIEIGYYQRPGGPKTLCVFRLPYGTQPLWPLTELLKNEVGIFQIGNFLHSDSDLGPGDFGGNLEVITPWNTNQLGKIVIGNTRSPDLMQFLVDQEVQSPFQVITSWLEVSHIDEIFGFHPSSNQVVVADPQEAYNILNAVPVADRGRSVFFATGSRPESGVASADAASSTRIETGIDHTGTSWNYVRIYDDSGSGAVGQIAHISSRGVGFIEIDTVWRIPSKIINGGPPGSSYMDLVLESAPARALSWFVAPQAGDKYVLMEGIRRWATGAPAPITVEEILADSDFEDLNLINVQLAINTLKSTLNTQAEGNLSFLKVPVLYLGEESSFETNREGIAFTPGLSNFQLVNRILYFPRQFSPLDAAGNDLFETAAKAVIPGALFVDDWDPYHREGGEVHCGTYSLRNFPTHNWWEHLTGIIP